jgi:hypothetical protein
MTQIIGWAGRKQAGKSTICNFIIGHSMMSLGIVRGGFTINEQGQLHISDLFGDQAYDGIFDVSRDNQGMKDFLKQHLDEYVKLYSFAEYLKVDVAINILGLTREQVFGSNEQKNTPTHLRWENMPGIVSFKDHEWIQICDSNYTEHNIKEGLDFLGVVRHEPGPMTAREVLQFVGTEVFRRMYENVWVDATIRKIVKEKPGLALISDVRFPNEVAGVQQHDGIVIKLTRTLFPEDNHASESSLDKDKFDWQNFNYVIDNQNMNIEQQNKEVYNILYSLGLFKE